MACRRLVGKVAVVTASTDGIGFAIAERLGREGASTVISSRKQKNVDSAVEKLTKQGLNVMGVQCHVGKPEDRGKLLNETLKKFGAIDILVSNAGTNPTSYPIMPEPIWDKIFDTNVKSSYMLAKEFIPHLEKTKGSIVFVSSVTAFNPLDPLAAYGVTKTTLQGLTKALATPLAAKGVRVNAIAPGVIKTKFSRMIWDGSIPNDVYLDKIPLNRIGEPSECAGATAFLVSDDASYVTGETIIISGGMHCRL